MAELYRIPLTGGVNLLADPRNIRDDEAVQMKNLVPVRPGVMQTRGALTGATPLLFNADTGSLVSATFGPWVDSPLFMMLFIKGFGISPSRVLLYAYTLDGMPVLFGVPIFLFAGLDDLPRRPFTLAYAGRLHFLSGLSTTDAPAYSIGRNEMTLLPFTFAGTGNTDIRPRLATTYRSRVVWAHFGLGHENTLVFSDNLRPNVIGNDVLASNGRNVSLVAASDGDEIIGLVEVMLTSTGAPISSGLLVLRRYSSYLLVGEPDQTTGGTNSLEINRMSVAAGCASPSTITHTPYGVLWAGQDEVWAFQAGQNPRPVGTKIRPALMRTPRNYGYKLSGAYFNGFYRLTAFSAGQTISTTEGVGEQWFLDLRNGLPADANAAQWYGPQIYNVPTQVAGFALDPNENPYGIMVRDERPAGTDKLYGFERTSNLASTANYTVVVEYDSDSTHDVPAVGANAPFNIDTAIKPDLITKEYDLGDPMLQKVYDGMEANVWASNDGRLLVQGILDGGAQNSEKNLDVSAIGFSPGVDTLTASGLSMPRAPQAVAAFDADRPLGTTVQLRVQGQSGILVDTSNNEWAFEDNNAIGDDAIVGVAQIPTGFYATASSLVEAIVTAMDAINAGHGSSYAGGLFTFTGANDKLTIMFETNTVAATAVTAAQRAKTSRLGAILGFDTSINNSEVFPSLVGSAMRVYDHQSPIWEINGLGMRLEVIPRRPS